MIDPFESPRTAEVFIDFETTGLNRRTRQIWEAGWIVRLPDGQRFEHAYMVNDVDLSDADPVSLDIGRFWERHPRGGQADSQHLESQGIGYVSKYELAEMLANLPKGATWIGAVPWFDEHSAAELVWSCQEPPGRWHYHLVDVEAMAAGALGLRPSEGWSFDFILKALGLSYDEADRHTALGDARMVERAHDSLLEGLDPFQTRHAQAWRQDGVTHAATSWMECLDCAASTASGVAAAQRFDPSGASVEDPFHLRDRIIEP